MPSSPVIESDRSAHGLIAWLESTRVRLPLKGVECRFEVTGGIASVELDQIFHQDNAKPLDCTYSFPLPAGAAVYRCEMHVNGRVIRARVDEQAAARKTYEERKAAGQRAALVETERENLFTLSLGNVQPQDLIVIRFAFFQKLDRLNHELSLHVPLCPGVRYIPGKPLLRSPSGKGTVDDTDQTPDASRISPPRIDALHPDAAYFYVQGKIAATDAEAATITSPSHPFLTRLQADGFVLELASQNAVPDRDLVLRWHEPKELTLAPRAWRSTRDGETFALVELRAPKDLPVVGETEGQDFYFLVDRSGSMEGGKWISTCAGLHAFVGLLGLHDRVNVTLFESSFVDFAEGPMPATKLASDRRFRDLVKMGVDGGTELLPALNHALKLVARHTTAEKRSARLILITDGQVDNEAAIVEEMRKHPGLPMYVLGIDTAVNDAFLKTLGRVTGGGCTLQTPADDITATVKSLGARLHHPALTHLAAEGDWESAGEQAGNLYADDAMTLSLRCRGEVNAKIIIRGKRADGTEQRFEIQPQAIVQEAIPLLWARERISAALDREDNKSAIDLAKRYTLLCKGAAFVAWDEQESVTVATEEIIQPAQHVGGAMPVMASCAPAPTGLAMPKRSRGFGGADKAKKLSEPLVDAMELGLTQGSEESRFSLKRLRGLFRSGSNEEALANDALKPVPSATWTDILDQYNCPPKVRHALLAWYTSLAENVRRALLQLARDQQFAALAPAPSLKDFVTDVVKTIEHNHPSGADRDAMISKFTKITAPLLTSA